MKDIKLRVDRLVRQHTPRNPFDLVIGMNAILVHDPLVGVRGFYQYFRRNNIIYIDEMLPDTEKSFVLAHELGHMLLHKKSNAIFMDTRTCLNTSRYEMEANTFAMHLLVSDEDIEKYRDYTLEQLSRTLGYHQKLVGLRLKK